MTACIRALNPSEASSGIVTKAEPGLNAVSDLLPDELKSDDENRAEEPSDASPDLPESADSQEQQDTDPSEKMSTQLPTMWLGAQNGQVFVHSSKADWSTCIMKVRPLVHSKIFRGDLSIGSESSAAMICSHCRCVYRIRLWRLCIIAVACFVRWPTVAWQCSIETPKRKNSARTNIAKL